MKVMNCLSAHLTGWKMVHTLLVQLLMKKRNCCEDPAWQMDKCIQCGSVHIYALMQQSDYSYQMRKKLRMHSETYKSIKAMGKI